MRGPSTPRRSCSATNAGVYWVPAFAGMTIEARHHEREQTTPRRGVSEANEPGIHSHERGVWIPDLRRKGASRNDEFGCEEKVKWISICPRSSGFSRKASTGC